MRNALLVLLFMMALGISGCNLFQGHQSTGTGLLDHLPTTGQQLYTNTVVKTDYLFAVFMVAAVGGMIAGMAGLKMGWIVAGGNIGGIVLYLTVARFGQWLALGGLIAAAAVVVAMLLRNRQFQFQHVGAIEEIKDKLPDDLRETIGKILFKNQDRTTEGLVTSIRSALDRKKEKAEQKHIRLLKKLREEERLALRKGLVAIPEPVVTPAQILEEPIDAPAQIE